MSHSVFLYKNLIIPCQISSISYK